MRSSKQFCLWTLLVVCASLTQTRSDELVINTSGDSFINPSLGNAGGDPILSVGDLNASYIWRGVFAFDLGSALLDEATIESATLTFKVRERDSGSPTAPNTINTHQLNKSFTEAGVTWTSRNGVENWNTPGGDFGPVIASTAANAGEMAEGIEIEWSGEGLASAVRSEVGGTLYLIAKLATEDTNRSIFRFYAREYSEPAVLTLSYKTEPKGTVFAFH